MNSNLLHRCKANWRAFLASYRQHQHRPRPSKRGLSARWWAFQASMHRYPKDHRPLCIFDDPGSFIAYTALVYAMSTAFLAFVGFMIGVLRWLLWDGHYSGWLFLHSYQLTLIPTILFIVFCHGLPERYAQQDYDRRHGKVMPPR